VRPLGVPALEDKIVQQAAQMILEPILEAEFIGLSYGFRPGRSQHDALDALVPRHRGFDRLGFEVRECVSGQTKLDAAGLPWNATDEAALL
jgi:hypothetical protein